MTVRDSWRISFWPRTSSAPTRPTSGAPIWSPGCWPRSRPVVPNAGRFGTDAQDADFNAGNYDQGLALAALAAAGVKADAASISWLQNQQCADGGWTIPDNVSTPCDPDPIGAAFPNEDTNTTSLAIQGLAAQSALTRTGLDERPGLPDLRPGRRRRMGLFPEYGRQSRDVRSRLDRAGDPGPAGPGAVAHQPDLRPGSEHPADGTAFVPGDLGCRYRRLLLPGDRLGHDRERPRHQSSGPGAGRVDAALSAEQRRG